MGLILGPVCGEGEGGREEGREEEEELNRSTLQKSTPGMQG